jgi:hypothetical protein
LARGFLRGRGGCGWVSEPKIGASGATLSAAF